jgi:hypothetical protein
VRELVTDLEGGPFPGPVPLAVQVPLLTLRVPKTLSAQVMRHVDIRE